MTSGPLGHLLDSAFSLLLLVALIAGGDVRWIIGVLLALSLLTSLTKAFNSFLEPIVKALKVRAQ